jgi:hypothetical protein
MYESCQDTVLGCNAWNCYGKNYGNVMSCNNVAVGYNTMRYMDGGGFLRNTVVGARAMFGCDSASQYITTANCVRDNIFLGAQAAAWAGWYCGSGVCGLYENIGIGYRALGGARCGCCIVAVGSNAMYRGCLQQEKPVVVGPYSINSSMTGACCFRGGVVIGPYNACWGGSHMGVIIGTMATRNSKGTANVVVGYNAHCQGGSSTSSATSKCNVILGAYAGKGGRYWCRNVAVGMYAFFCNGCMASSSTYHMCDSVAIGYNAGSATNTGTNSTCGSNSNVYIGAQVRIGSAVNNVCNQITIGACACGQNCYATFGNASSTGVYVCGTVTKGSGTFQIVHPNPKKINKWLHHSFTESPNAGDNLYRYKFDISNCEHCFKLPNYYKYLNTCNMAWVYPTDHFGQGHAKIDDKKENLIIKTDTDGCYTVLLMGTRCDAWALKHWQGTERHKRPDMWSCNIKKYGAPK